MPKGRAITEDTKDEVVQMYRQAIRVPDIAEELGVSLPTVYKVLKERGMTDESPLPRHLASRESQELLDIIEAYVKTTEPVIEIIKRFDISHTDLYAILKEAGVEVRQRVPKPAVDQDLDKALAMYTHETEEFPLWEIEQQTGVTAQRLNRYLHKLNIPLKRPRSRHKSFASVRRAPGGGGNDE